MKFNIQRFADTITSSSELKIVTQYYDSDDRTITLDNPKNDLTATQIIGAINYGVQNEAIIGDRTGASLVGASSAKIVEKTRTKLDLT